MSDLNFLFLTCSLSHCFDFRNYFGSRKEGGSVIDIEQRILAEVGELCYKPSANHA